MKIRTRIDANAPESHAWVGGVSPYAVPLAKRPVVYEVVTDTPGARALASALSMVDASVALLAIERQERGA